MRNLFFIPLICLVFISLGNSLPLQHQTQPCQPATAAAQLNAGFQPPTHIKLEAITFGEQTAVPLEELNAITTSLTQRTYRDAPHWIDELRAQVTDAWQHRGYFRVQIGDARAESLGEAAGEKRFAADVKLEAGQIYQLKGIGFTNNSQFSAPELRAMFPMADGDMLDTHLLQQGMTNLRKNYGARGFINFTAVPAFTVDEANATVSLQLEIEEGKRYIVSQIRILGLDPSLTRQLLRDLALAEGKVFDTSLFSEFFERNRTVLPADARPEDVSQRVLDDQRGTVELTLDFRDCQ